MKRITRSRTDRMILGVMGGVGEYFAVDPNLIRLGYLIILLVTGVLPGLIAYFIAAIIIPEAPLLTPSSPEAAHDFEAV